MSQIIANVPVWVWPLFIVLVFLGMRATQDRSVPLVVMYLLPFLGLISFNTLIHLPQQTFVWGVYVVGFSVGAIIGLWVQHRWILDYSHHKLFVRGEWFTLITMMIIFFASFVNGIMSTVAPVVVSGFAFLVVFVGILSVAAGFFAGRAFQVILYVRARG